MTATFKRLVNDRSRYELTVNRVRQVAGPKIAGSSPTCGDTPDFSISRNLHYLDKERLTGPWVHVHLFDIDFDIVIYLISISIFFNSITKFVIEIISI